MTDLGIYGDSIAEQKNGERFEREQKQLALAKESQCPFCGSHETDYGPTTIDSGKCFQQGECMDCNKQWAEHYTMSEIEELE